MADTADEAEGARDLNEILSALRQIANDAGEADHPADSDAEAIRRIALILSTLDRQ